MDWALCVVSLAASLVAVVLGAFAFPLDWPLASVQSFRAL